MPPKRRFRQPSRLHTLVLLIPAYRFTLISLAFWFILTLFINLMLPESVTNLFFFYLIVFATLFSTFFASFRQLFSGLLLSLFMVLCLFLAQLHLLNLFNFLLLFGLAASFYYLIK